MAVTGLDRLKRQILALPEVHRRAAAEALRLENQRLAAAIARAAPKRSGAMARGVKAEPQKTVKGGAASIKGGFGLAWKVSAPFPAKFVEFGTKATAARGSRRNRNYKRTVVMTRSYRAHHATRAQPFFWPTVAAYKRLMKTRVVRTSNKAAKSLATVR